ncbi:MAG: hypothetical protein ACRERC_27430, partial [Candidatus Binatia bacterium]
MSDPAPIRSDLPAAPAAIQVPTARLLQDWKQAHGRVGAYLAALGVPEAEHAGLAEAAVERALQRDAWQGDAVAESLRALRELLPEGSPPAAAAARSGVDPFTAWRLAHPVAPAAPALLPPLSDGRLCAAPRLARHRMVPEWIERRFTRRLLGRLRRRAPRSPRAEETHEPLRS